MHRRRPALRRFVSSPRAPCARGSGHSDYQSMKPYIEIAEKTKADAMKTFEDAMSPQRALRMRGENVDSFSYFCIIEIKYLVG